MTAPKATQQEPPDHPTDSRPGTWSRLELMQMNARFAIAMARALGEKIGRKSEPHAQGTSDHPRPRSEAA
jgi:hypothetical protein